MYRKAFILAFFSLSILASPIDNAVNNGIEWLYSHQNSDSTWGSKPLRFFSTSVVLKSLILTENRDPVFEAGVEKFLQEALPSVDHMARFIEVILPLKEDTTGIVDTLLSFQNPDKGFGIYP